MVAPATYEEHLQTTSTGTTGDQRNAKVLYDLYLRVAASDVAKFALDGATPAIHDGTSYGTPSDQTFFENNGAYMVIEFESAYGLDCQLKVSVDTTAEDIFLEYAPSGGYASAAFPGNTSGALTLSAAPPSATADWYWSIVDLDGYPYLRALQYDGGWASSFRFGGYDPIDSAENTKPHCLLIGTPIVGAGSTASSWGYTSGNTNNRNRVPNEYFTDGGYPSAISAGGYAYLSGNERVSTSAGAGISPKGRALVGPVFLHRVSPQAYGKFGDYDMFWVDDSKADRDTDTAATYLVVNDLMVRWNP